MSSQELGAGQGPTILDRCGSLSAASDSRSTAPPAPPAYSGAPISTRPRRAGSAPSAPSTTKLAPPLRVYASVPMCSATHSAAASASGDEHNAAAAHTEVLFSPRQTRTTSHQVERLRWAQPAYWLRHTVSGSSRPRYLRRGATVHRTHSLSPSHALPRLRCSPLMAPAAVGQENQ